jgi:phenylacetate-CoA ligase
VRYRTGDYARFSPRADEELPMPEIEAVVGRDYEFLVSSTGRQISLTAINMHDSIFDGLLGVQFAQGKPGQVEFRYQPGPVWQPARVESMRAGLLRKLGDDFDLRLREVDEVETPAAGKHRWLVKLA